MMFRIKNYIKKILKWWYKSAAHTHVFVPVTSQRLQKFFQFADIKILDIGARGGPFKEFQAFAPFLRVVLCDADKEEAARLEESLRAAGVWRSATVVPAALSTRAGAAELHIAEHAGLSSLLDINKEEISKYHSIDSWGGVVKTVSIPALTLDQAAERYHFRDCAFMKLDTQGTELDILKSGPKTLSSVCAVYIESELIPLYKGQPLFGEVHAFLEKHGFRLIDIKRTAHRRKIESQPTYSKRELTWAHGLYIRERNDDGSPLSPRQAVRLACMLAMFEYFDYALSLLERPDVRAYCAENGFAGIEKDMKEYAEAFWVNLRRRLNWFERRLAVATNITDRKIER